MTKKLTTIPATIIAALTFAGVARANPSTASATCEDGIVYSGHDYPSAGNTVTVYWDGHVAAGFPKTYGTQTSGTVANPDKTAAHSWAVVWDRYNGTDGDRTQSGQIQACAVAPTTTTTTTLASTTTVGSSSTLVVTDDELTPVVAPPAVVAVDLPPVPQPQGVLSASGGQTLPQTGGTTGGLIWAAALVAAGFIALFVSRRRARP